MPNDALMVSSGEGDDIPLGDWLDRANQAVDAALTAWRPVAIAKNGARVFAGKIEGSPTISMLWQQEFDVCDQAVLLDVFHNHHNMEAHATVWDHTYQGSDTLSHLPPVSESDCSVHAVHWKFNASPLSQRELLFLSARKSMDPEGNTIVFGYPTVSDKWLS